MAATGNTAAELNIQYVQGDSITQTFSFYDETGAPITVDLWAWEMVIKKCNGDVLGTYTTAPAITFDDDNVLRITVDDTTAISNDLIDAKYTISATVAGVKRTWFYGQFKAQKIQ
jgi:hypothetical protein